MRFQNNDTLFSILILIFFLLFYFNSNVFYSKKWKFLDSSKRVFIWISVIPREIKEQSFHFKITKKNCVSSKNRIILAISSKKITLTKHIKQHLKNIFVEKYYFVN